jgi:hypothetical protein
MLVAATENDLLVLLSLPAMYLSDTLSELLSADSLTKFWASLSVSSE